MVTEQDVINVLKECQDPEIPLNIFDLGLIYDIKVNGNRVNIKMSLTQRGCPMHSVIKEEARKKLLNISGVEDIEIKIVWNPPWNQDMMTEEGKRKLGLV